MCVRDRSSGAEKSRGAKALSKSDRVRKKNTANVDHLWLTES